MTTTIPTTRYNPLTTDSSACSRNLQVAPPPATACSRNLQVAPGAPAASPAAPRVSLGGIAKAKPAGSKTDYPVLPDTNGALSAIADRIRQRTDEFDAIEAALKLDKQELAFHARPFFFQHCQGKVEVPSSVQVVSPTGGVLVTFTSRYKALPDDAPIRQVLGDQTDALFRQSFALEIDGDKIPATKAQELVNDLIELFGRYQCPDALASKEVVKPVDNFHAARHTLLTPDQNLAVEEAIPMGVMVKVKGRK